ncbi:MAG: EAL domain-containing protein [Pseudobdellovibrionaceae bacterium]
MSDHLTDHLTETLRLSGQVALIWDTSLDDLRLFGDTRGLFDLLDAQLPDNAQAFHKWIHPQDLPLRLSKVHEVLEKAVASSSQADFEVRYQIRRNDGSFAPVIEKGSAFCDGRSGGVVRSLLMLDAGMLREQITLAADHDIELQRADLIDAAQGRAHLQAKLHDMQQETRALDRGFLLSVGIDRLSVLNEVYGADKVDRILVTIGKRLEELALEGARVYRMSGDVYGVLFPERRQINMDDLARYVLQNFMRRPVTIDGEHIHVNVSIGGKRLDDLSMSASSILVKCERALQAAKAKGRGSYTSYETIGEASQTAHEYRQMLDTGNDFLQALRSNRVCLAFQPVQDTRKNATSFYECLIRLVTESGQIVSAGHFIEAVESMGLTRLVDLFCVRSAIRELMTYPDLHLSVNVSNHTLSDPTWLREVSESLRNHPDVAPRLIVEITESAAMQDISFTLKIVRDLQALGCRVALDDFGSGQTSFSQLRDLGLNIVKLDKSFVLGLESEENKLFIETLHALAAGMHMETVAEGAEDNETINYLASVGIEHIQGFAVGRPSVERLWLPPEHPERMILAATTSR